MIEICAVGGYDEIGRNMTAVNIDGRVVILDMGIHVSNFIEQQGKEDVYGMSAKQLIDADCIPDDGAIRDWWDSVDAIIPTHAHLDHVGALPFLAEKFDCPVVATPFTIEVIKRQLEDNKISLDNEFKELLPNSRFRIHKSLEIEFIHMTHSTPQTVMVALHTKYGTILYGNDFKFDNSPGLGKKPNYRRLRSLGNSGEVIALVADSTRVSEHRKTHSEGVAKAMLKDVMLGIECDGKAVIVTTFASHLARLKTITELGKRMGREVVFIGRSIAKYVGAGEDAGIVHFTDDVRVIRYSRQAERFLRRVAQKKNVDQYLFVVTGHQGEPRAVLSRIANDDFALMLKQGDSVLFSCETIPVKINQNNRSALEKKLKKKKVRMFTDLHVSGHGSREDMRDLIKMTKPKTIIPAHGPKKFRLETYRLAKEMGYSRGDILMMNNGEHQKLLVGREEEEKGRRSQSRKSRSRRGGKSSKSQAARQKGPSEKENAPSKKRSRKRSSRSRVEGGYKPKKGKNR